jgi:hypothetical protein
LCLQHPRLGASFWVKSGFKDQPAILLYDLCARGCQREGINMAKVWPVYGGKEPTRGGPWVELALSDAIELFDLKQSDFVSDLRSTPRFGSTNLDLTFAGYKHIVVEIDDNEARSAGWKAGFYKSRIKPKEGFRRLIQQPFVSVLGADNVERVEYQAAIDSQGRPALRIMVVIAPGAIQRFPRGAVIDASVRLHERLSEMRDERTPIIEYATEAELLQDAGP